MSSEPVRKVSRQDIQLVQNLIERCLQLYMNQKEVTEMLLDQAKIEPGFTELVWQKLEEENREFFNAYYLRLVLKHQIIEFNRLLEQQGKIMHQIHPSAVNSLPISNGSHVPQLRQNTTCYATEHTGHSLKHENMHNSMSSNLTYQFSNGLQSSVHSAVNMQAHASVDTSSSVLSSQGANVRMMQGLNARMIKSEAGNSDSFYMFGTEGSVLNARPSIGDATVGSFARVEPCAQPLDESFLETDTSPFGFLSQIPRNFSLSDLTADFAQSTDILESYARSPFLASETDKFLDNSETDKFLDNSERGDHHGSKRLDPIAETLSYEGFGSD